MPMIKKRPGVSLGRGKSASRYQYVDESQLCENLTPLMAVKGGFLWIGLG